MLTHLKSTLLVLLMLMHLSLGHLTLLPGKFHPFEFFSQLDLERQVDSRWALAHISSWSSFLHLGKAYAFLEQVLLGIHDLVHDWCFEGQ